MTIQPATYTECSDCGKRIPWDRPRVLQMILKGSEIVDKRNLCMECASR